MPRYSTNHGSGAKVSRAHSMHHHHMRSQSMPEAVYIQHVIGLPVLPAAPMPKPVEPKRSQGAGTSLRRSQTNAGDFRPLGARNPSATRIHPSGSSSNLVLAGASRFGGSSQYLAGAACGSNWSIAELSDYAVPHHVKPRPSMSKADYHMVARSRSNIASLCPPQAAVLQPGPNYLHRPQPQHYFPQAHQLHPAYYQHNPGYNLRHHKSTNSHRSLGYLGPIPEPPMPGVYGMERSKSLHKDLFSTPLHVDCSVEYDLGNQPKIPKDSAPLLIIHPDYKSLQAAAANKSPTSLTADEEVYSKSSSANSTPMRHKATPHRSLGQNHFHSLVQSAPSKRQPRTTANGGLSRHSSFLETFSSASALQGLDSHQHYLSRSQLQRQQMALNNGSSPLKESRIPGSGPKLSRAASMQQHHLLLPRYQQQLKQLEEDQQHAQTTASRPAVQRVLSKTKRRSSIVRPSGSNHSSSSSFHLSLPDISADVSREEEDDNDLDEEIEKEVQELTRSSQHPGSSGSRARLNLNAKLDKLSPPSLNHHQSGSNYSSLMMTSGSNKSSSGLGTESHPSSAASSIMNYEEAVGHHRPGRADRTATKDSNVCDSGLGTPSSLTMEQEERNNSANKSSSNSVNSGSNNASNLTRSKWKSSVSGRER